MPQPISQQRLAAGPPALEARGTSGTRPGNVGDFGARACLRCRRHPIPRRRRLREPSRRSATASARVSRRAANAATAIQCDSEAIRASPATAAASDWCAARSCRRKMRDRGRGSDVANLGSAGPGRKSVVATAARPGAMTRWPTPSAQALAPQLTRSLKRDDGAVPP